MNHNADCPEGRSQLFTFPRRELLQRLASAALLTIFPVHQSAAKLPAKYPVPSFQVGDKVADHWIDEFEIAQIEYGEVVGICWHPDEEVWGYHVNWTSGTMPSEYYPCYDGHLTIGGDLRGHDLRTVNHV
ncbi:hypothetical protein [Microcoleus sp. B3-D7]|uniref:hypothetical protein n=1 Tax=Microcoleus sp. B3-D7 TaxID=2818659 RepID=UPI002FD4B208